MTHVSQCSLQHYLQYLDHGNNPDVHWQKNDKETVVHIYNGILLSHKKECIWVSSDEVDEPITWSEVSQKEEDKYCILKHIYRI